jgi:acetylornithine deacetylase/succinyl-diaminopimelate desuccinylase-like protein
MSLSDYLADARERQLSELCEWLRIPSISTLSIHRDDCRAAAAWLAAAMTKAGLEHVEIHEGVGNPLVYADWLHAGDDKPTVLIYGHYDVQPVDPLELWTTPPFEPTVRAGNLYARGASDDKGQTFLHVKAVEALLATTGRLPVNVKFIVEGEEESGGRTISAYVPDHAEKLAADVCLVSDTGILAPDQPVITYGLRGMWSGEVTVTGPATDLHSGLYGGAVHNANQALAELLASLHDADGRVNVPGFYDDVRPLSELERAEMAKVPYRDAELRRETGVAAPYGEPEYNVVERIGARPTLEINGMWGGFIGEGGKTVIPSKAYAKLSCRLVPDQDPAHIGALVTAALRNRAPATVSVEVMTRHTGMAFVSPLELPAVQAAARAYAKVFGVEPLYMRSGGGIPIVNTLHQVLDAPVVLMGFGLPDDNLHAPNEKFHLDNFYRGIATSIAFLEELTA